MTEQPLEREHVEKILIEMAVDSWKFSKLFMRVLGKLDAGESTRYINQVRYFQKNVDSQLSAARLRLVNVEGQPYDLGMAVSALNIEDFSAEDLLWVEQMIEPIVMGDHGVKKQGTVMLRKGQA